MRITGKIGKNAVNAMPCRAVAVRKEKSMKYEFAVAAASHMNDAPPEYIGKKRFADYRSAKDFANTYDDCNPTIYIIIDDKYVFCCCPYANHVFLTDDMVVQYVYSIELKPWGYVKTLIWWEDFVQNPQEFYHLAQGTI